MAHFALSGRFLVCGEANISWWGCVCDDVLVFNGSVIYTKKLHSVYYPIDLIVRSNLYADQMKTPRYSNLSTIAIRFTMFLITVGHESTLQSMVYNLSSVFNDLTTTVSLLLKIAISKILFQVLFRRGEMAIFSVFCNFKISTTGSFCQTQINKADLWCECIESQASE